MEKHYEEVREKVNEGVIISLEEINESNLKDLLTIEVFDEQNDNVPNIQLSYEASLKYPGTKAFAITNPQGQIVGFLSYGVYEGARCPKIFRLIIDKNQQGKGYGKSALNSAIKRIFEEYQTDEIDLCYNQLDPALKALYSKAGFVDIEVQPCETRPTGKMLARLSRK